ncbi:MAG: DUF3034 family protein [Gammaproteobacteria bacterium]
MSTKHAWRPCRFALPGLVLLVTLTCAQATAARDWLANNSRILATGGGTQVEGQAGGGIVPWAVLAGYGSSGEVGASAFYTHVELDDYALDAVGAAVSFDNRIELSVARQQFDLGTLGEALGLADKELRQDVLGLKLRLAGDLIYGRLPQLAFGMQYKRHLDFGIPAAVGAVRRRDADFYLAATKLWLAGPFDRNVFANATLRYTRANQGGLLGFGGDRDDSRDLVFEGSVGIFLTRHVALGGEYRQHPDNLSFSEQDDWIDAFIGIFPNKHVSLVAAWANLGTIATLDSQRGWYLSLEVAF